MGDVLDRWRLNNGWTVLDNKTQMATISTFVHELDADDVPHTLYGELYSRVLKTRVATLNDGKQVSLTFGVELMLAEWNGPNGLRAELRQREIDTGRTLTGQATSQCTKCFGTGIQTFFDDAGNVIGARPGCDHEYLEDSEPTVANVDKALAAIRTSDQDETAGQILRRLKISVTYEWSQSEEGSVRQRDLWTAIAVLGHAERYVRDFTP
jgi:hypothetical protein